MKTAICTVQSTSPISFSRFHATEKKPKESDDDYRKRTWKEHCHYEGDKVVIPQMMIKNALSAAASYLGERISAKGRATFTKRFKAGLHIQSPLVLPVTRETIQEETLFLPSDGVAGSGRRVVKTYPIVHEWKGDFTCIILDDVIDRKAFERHLAEAGRFIGLGRFRPINGGYYGRFNVINIKWSES